MDGIAFVTDQEGVIQAIGESNWNFFAKENAAPELSSDMVIGKCLFDFIEGPQVKRALQKIMERISEDPNWCWVISCSCDAPDRKRHQRQYLRPLFRQNRCAGFLFQAIERSSQLRPPMGLFEFKRLKSSASLRTDLPKVLMCSWCQRIQYKPISGDRWIEADVYCAAKGSSDVQLSHGICDSCAERI